MQQRHAWIAPLTVLAGFGWRIWLAHATFFNVDEAWHYSIANQNSFAAAYKASLTLFHPPLLILILFFWRKLGTSDLMLRMPSVIAGAALCWVFYKWASKLFGRTAGWVGLILMTFLPPMIALSAELRQYALMMLFCVGSAYLLECALERNSAWLMAASGVSLYGGLLSHYSAFLFAAALGIYGIVRIVAERPRPSVIATWAIGQAVGVGLGALLYVIQISKLGTVYPRAQSLHRIADWYLGDWYFHSRRDHVLSFLWKGTFGVFRFICGQTTIGHLATVLFIAGIALLFCGKDAAKASRPRTSGFLLAVPLVLSWIAVLAGLYPFGRTRHCVFLAVFGLAAVGVAIAKIARDRVEWAAGIAVGLALICQVFGTPQGRDMLPVAQQRHEHMDRALEFIRTHISPEDVIFTDKATSFQLDHYLCGKQPASIETVADGFGSFRCGGLRVIATGPNDTELQASTFADRLQKMRQIYGLSPQTPVWVVQGGWASGLGESLRLQSPQFAGVEPQVFDRYLEIFLLPRAS
jgi:4-amino-4-deoxy-L-arabinose transferase-like glycosyltransferase